MCLSEKAQQNDGKRADATVATLEDLIQIAVNHIAVTKITLVVKNVLKRQW